MIAYFTGDMGRAVLEYEFALRFARDGGDGLQLATCTNDLAILALEDGRLAEAEAYARESIEVARTATDAILESNALATLADLRIGEGDLAAVRPLACDALRIQSSRWSEANRRGRCGVGTDVRAWSCAPVARQSAPL